MSQGESGVGGWANVHRKRDEKLIKLSLYPVTLVSERDTLGTIAGEKRDVCVECYIPRQEQKKKYI